MQLDHAPPRMVDWTEATPCPLRGMAPEQLTTLAKLLREQLEARGWSTSHLEDDYLASVLNVPGRTFAYARDRKLIRALEWHRKVGEVNSAQVAHLVRSGSMYWHGCDTAGRPILWVRPGLKDWAHLDVDAEVRYHVFMIEKGIRRMRRGVTTFAIVASTSGFGLRNVNLKLMRSLLTLATTAYPDRLGALTVAPVNWAVSALFGMLRPLMPVRVVGKVKFMRKPHAELQQIMDASLIPDFMGGECVHPPDVDVDGDASADGGRMGESASEDREGCREDGEGGEGSEEGEVALLKFPGCIAEEAETPPPGSPDVSSAIVGEVVEVNGTAEDDDSDGGDGIDVCGETPVSAAAPGASAAVGASGGSMASRKARSETVGAAGLL